MDTISLSAPAKVNLRLVVEGRRPADGYHLLSMLNVTVAFGDEVTVRRTSDSGVLLEVEGEIGAAVRAELSDPRTNLAARAATKLIEEWEIPDGIEITLHKRIPLGAGLGGGSSDAAAVLRAFDRMYEARRPGVDRGESLARIGLELGADVPYLLHRGPALVHGIGEEITPIDLSAVHDHPCALVIPPAHCATAEVFKRFAATRPEHPSGPDAPLRALRRPGARLDLPGIARLATNDLAPCVTEMSPLVGAVLRRLRLCGEIVSGMSGSGSTLFALPHDPEEPAWIDRVAEIAAECGGELVMTRLQGTPPAW